MAIQQAAAQALAAVQRARALFGTTPQPSLPQTPSLAAAAHSLADTGRRAVGLSGELVNKHHQFVGAARRVLTSNANTDTALKPRLSAAANLTEDGRHRLDSILERTRALAREAASARSPAAQRAVLGALHTEVSRANAVIDSTKQQAVGIAGQIRTLDYHSGKHGHGTIRDADFAQDGGPRPKTDDPADEAARRYAETQRAADQALVDQANREGRTNYLPGMAGRPGYMTDEQAAAAARLRDYQTLTDPNSHIALHGGQDARKFAGQRLNDFNTSKIVAHFRATPSSAVMHAPARRPGYGCRPTWKTGTSPGASNRSPPTTPPG